MFEIDDKTNAMKVVRKDTAIFGVELENHVLAEGDKVIFTVNKEIEQETPIRQLEATSFNDGIALFTLSSSDTDIEEGYYLYDIQVETADGRIDTVVSPTRFKVIGGITY